MTNTFETVAASAKGSHAVGRKSLRSMITRVGTSGEVVVLRGILALIALSSIVWFAIATAQAQELLSHDAAPASTTGWWSPETAAADAAPHLLLSMADAGQLRVSGALRTSTAQPSNYRPTALMDYSIVNLGSLRLAPDAPETEFSSLTDGNSLLSESFFSSVETKYTLWESSFADSRSLTNLNGVSVYPLLQVTYANWHLPITLYVPPLRGGGAR